MDNKQTLRYKKDTGAFSLSKAHSSDAGYDVKSRYEYTLKPSQRILISTGLQIALPEGTYGRVAPRSGLAVKHGIDVMAGVIDQEYRGELQIILINLGQEDYVVKPGDKVAQLIVEYVCQTDLQETDNLDENTTRNKNGFGSSGM